MLNLAFILVVGCALAAVYGWAFRTLPRERWQFVAAAPSTREESGGWRATNFTFYGLFSASAYALGAAAFIVLMGSVGATFAASMAAVAAVVAVCAPASNLLVRIVEGKRYGFTVGGASFVGLFAAPAAVWLVDQAGFAMPFIPALAAMSIAYVLGESFGRLACISFGCCYGKRAKAASGWVRTLTRRFAFVFEGETRKIAFASRLDGTPVVPVQAMTASVFALLALVSTWLFLDGAFAAAVAVSIAGSQVWRVYSETLRADYRGEGTVSAYQYMAGFSAASAVVLPVVVGHESVTPDIAAGLSALWAPAPILALELLWTAAFLYMGRSTQTGAELSFHVRTDRI